MSSGCPIPRPFVVRYAASRDTADEDPIRPGHPPWRIARPQAWRSGRPSGRGWPIGQHHPQPSRRSSVPGWATGTRRRPDPGRPKPTTPVYAGDDTTTQGTRANTSKSTMRPITMFMTRSCHLGPAQVTRSAPDAVDQSREESKTASASRRTAWVCVKGPPRCDSSTSSIAMSTLPARAEPAAARSASHAASWRSTEAVRAAMDKPAYAARTPETRGPDGASPSRAAGRTNQRFTGRDQRVARVHLCRHQPESGRLGCRHRAARRHRSGTRRGQIPWLLRAT